MRIDKRLCEKCGCDEATEDLSTTELVAMLEGRRDVTTLRNPLCETQAKISYFDADVNDRILLSIYGPCIVFVIPTKGEGE